MNWVVGPGKANLGDYAEIDIPPGFRFAATEDAAVLLKQMNNPAPKALVGIMAPVYGRWMVVFEFNPVGYVREETKDKIDAEAVLGKLREKLQRQNQQVDKPTANSSVNWELEPRYSREDHSLEWAIRAENGTIKAVNHVWRIFGRDGVLDGIAVQPQQMAPDAIPLKQLMSGVKFREGHSYADYQPGDKLSKRSLTDLITADSEPNEKAISPLVWILSSVGVVVAVGVIGLVMVIRKKSRDAKRVVNPIITSAISIHANGVTKAEAKLEMPHPEQHEEHEHHHNGNGNGSPNGDKTRRRKIFDYNKYYSDLIFQVSDRTYEMDAPKPARNGAPTVKRVSTESANQTTLAANLGLIESQKHLIEEQQRLIREQTKLIEEKTRLIQEKNQVLEKQAELFGNNIF